MREKFMTVPALPVSAATLPSARTPGPWKPLSGYQLRGKYAGCIGIAHVDGYGQSGQPFVLLPPGAHDIQEANAHFIVRACNAHDDLVGTLREIMNCSGPTGIRTARALARIALAKIEAAP